MIRIPGHMLSARLAGVAPLPFIEVTLAGQGFNPDTIPFLIDTGADRSILHPFDADRLGIAVREIDFSSGAPISGVGGSMRLMPIPARAIFRTATDQYPRYVWVNSAVHLAEPSEENWDMPSLLGRDLLQLFRLVLEPSSAPGVHLEYLPDEEQPAPSGASA